jgi:Uma2 family endonuclease
MEPFSMATITESPPQAERTLADLLDELGNVPPNRVLLTPHPGTATEEDVLEVERRTGRAPELIDGVLVEKTVGYRESALASALIIHLGNFVLPKKLGIVTGEQGTLRILPGQVRIPDVCFISRNHFPGGKMSDAPIPGLVPDLAVEVLSPINSPGEMARKLRDYFAAGARLVWYIDPRSRAAKVYTALDKCESLTEADVLDGGEVLPGFRLPLSTLFADVEL